ncbi:hypothetical protein Q3G72_035018 [Acer saccharum]|nr:hypothetical protein Q3G72_035018 [Acer saccharum]
MVCSSADSAADDLIGASALPPSSAHYADHAPIEASMFPPSFADGSPLFATAGAQLANYAFPLLNGIVVSIQCVAVLIARITE